MSYVVLVNDLRATFPVMFREVR